MKYIFLLVFFISIGALYCQPNPFKMREIITDGVNEIEVAPTSVHKVINKEVSGEDFSIPIRVYYPSAQESLPILYHIHGGAWIGGDLNTHDNICRYLSTATNTIVVAVHYRRPPEHTYPAALEDCHFILKWIHRNMEKLKGNGEIFLIGDSAGGGLVSSLCFKNLDSESPIDIKGQILINPATDLRNSSATYNTYKAFVDWYVPSGIDKGHPYVSSLTAPSFKELPKSIIVVSEDDKIKEEGMLFHDRMLQDGQSSVIFEVKGVGHLAGHWTKNSEVAQPAVEFVTGQLIKWISE